MLVPPGVPVVLVPPGVPVVLVSPPGIAGLPVEPVSPALLGVAEVPAPGDVAGLPAGSLAEPPGAMVPVDPVLVPAWASTTPCCVAAGGGAAAIEIARTNVVIIASSFQPNLRSPTPGESASVRPSRYRRTRRRDRGASRGSKPRPMTAVTFRATSAA